MNLNINICFPGPAVRNWGFLENWKSTATEWVYAR